MRLRNEVSYDNSTFTNRNLAKTVRYGIEQRVTVNLFDGIKLTNNFTLNINSIAKKVKHLLNYQGKIVNDLNYKDGDLIKKMDKQSKNFKKYFKKLKFTELKTSILQTIIYYEKIIWC